MPYSLDNASIRKRLADAGLEAIPSDKECEQFRMIAAEAERVHGTPVDILGIYIAEVNRRLALLKLKPNKLWEL